jgi:uncharacterized protein
VIAVDTNLLVYAHREDSAWHAAAARAVTGLAEDRAAWGIPWPCLHEFLAIVTHPRLYRPPTPLAKAVEQIEAWRESPSLIVFAEPDGYWDELKRAVTQGLVVGPQVHDARIAALCLAHGVRELWTHDRDFGRFPSLTTRNPLI